MCQIMRLKVSSWQPLHGLRHERTVTTIICNSFTSMFPLCDVTLYAIVTGFMTNRKGDIEALEKVQKGY